jgi:glycosyltransferase involved in cell wall biosynthesis
MEAGEPIGGNIAAFLNLLERIPDCEPHLLYWGRGNADISIPVATEIRRDRVHRIIGFSSNRGMISRIRVCLESRRLLQRLKPWCVQSSSLDLLLAALMAVRPPGGFVFDLQDSRPWMRRWWIRPLVRALLVRTKFIVVTSPRFESDFLRRYQLISSKTPVLCIPNPVEHSRFREYHRRHADQDIVIGYIGTFRGAIAIRALVNAIRQARQTGDSRERLFCRDGT